MIAVKILYVGGEGHGAVNEAARCAGHAGEPVDYFLQLSFWANKLVFNEDSRAINF